jgi:LemA protein
MSNKAVVAVVVLVVAVTLGAACLWYGLTTYNRLVKVDESVAQQWSQVENVYQRRLDLIPNLVETVKAYVEYEQETLLKITEMRTRALSAMQGIKGSPTKEQLESYEEIQSGITGSLQMLYAVVENYPELKASDSFLALQSQLEGAENRITVERMRYNEYVKAYNTSIRQVPTKLVAKSLGFAPKGYFEASPEAMRAPKVEFGP